MDDETTLPAGSKTIPTICILHVGEKTKEASVGKLISFSVQTFQRVKLCTAARNKTKSTAYASIIRKLPEAALPHHGYHAQCYKNFTALKKNKIDAVLRQKDAYTAEDFESCSQEDNNTASPNSNFSRTASISVCKSISSETAHYVDRDILRTPPTIETNVCNKDENTTSFSNNILKIEHVSEATSLKLNSGNDKRLIEKDCCIFCDRSNKTYKYVKQKLIKYNKSEKELLYKKIFEIKDIGLLKKISESDSVNAHQYCRSAFNTKYKNFEVNLKQISGKLTEYQQSRELHKIAWNSFKVYVNQRIIRQKEIKSFQELFEYYLSLLKESGEKQELWENYTMRHLFHKMNTKYKDQLLYNFNNKTRDHIVYSADLAVDGNEARELYEKSKSDNLTIQARCLADKLRKEIFKYKRESEHEYNDVQSVFNGGNDEPKAVKEFFEVLIGGPDFKTQDGKQNDRARKEIYINTILQDILFMVTKGEILPTKHIILGLAIKSMVGSNKLIQLLNRHGYLTNANKIREIETDIANNILSRQSDVPEGIVPENNLSICTVFDNYDEMSETLSGAGTLHETVGICYQNETELTTPKTIDPIVLTRKRQRSLIAESFQLEPYYKKPKIQEKILPTSTETPADLPKYFRNAMYRDSVWIWMLALGLKNVPMWIGFNSKTVKDERKKQIVGYLKNYDSHSTDPATIIETLKASQNIAAECKERNILVYYDLNIAKPALQIQSTESPIYDNVFINFGPFHLFMAFFSALGTIFKDSGLTYYLTETNALSTGSVNGFSAGKHYNRCKRLHSILAAVLEKMHIETFLQQEGLSEDDIDMEYLESILVGNVDLSIPPSNNFGDLLQKYDAYSDKTRDGEHGVTAQFFMSYIDLVKVYLLMSRAVRMCDIDLFIYCLPMMTDLFFATNHPNYARWMVMYHNKLINIERTHPGLKEVFQNGGLSVKRQNIPFSGTPPDQTLEQTINRDAASRHTGVYALTNSYSARLRWTVTRSLRARFVQEAFESVGLNKKQDVTRDLKPSMIVKNNKTYSDLYEFSKSAINPFSLELPEDKLFNIATGKSCSPETAEYLLNVRKKGKLLREKFESECIEDVDRFEKPISRQKILTFATEGITRKVTRKNKTEVVKMTCNLFGRLCFLSIKKGIDMAVVLQYPLTLVPLSLSHVDGTMNKTDKSQLLRHLEKQVQSANLPKADYILIDGGFLLFSIPEKQYTTFKDFSKQILLYILKQFRCKSIDLVFDTYRVPSIKDVERLRRNEAGSVESLEYVIQGRDQLFPRNFKKFLLNKSFTDNLIKFLVQDWKLEENLSLLGDRTLRVTCETDCFLYKLGEVQIDTDMQCSHEEADVRLAFHCFAYSQKNSGKNVFVRSGDTDVLIIFLYNQKHFSANRIWLDFGTGKNRRVIDVTKLAVSLGEPLCDALPSLHAFTGSDYTAAFSRKGKIKPLTLLRNNTEYLDVFASLGSSHEITPEIELIISKFVCLMYGVNDCENVNDARIKLFYKQYGAKNKPFDKLKNADASLLPPCQNTLRQKILRTNFVSMMWKNATINEPLPNPLDHGWIIKDRFYYPLWFEGECVPSTFEEIELNQEFDSVDDDDIIRQSSSDESDSYDSDE